MGTFRVRTDHYVLNRLREICAVTGEDLNALIELSTKEAIAELEVRMRMKNGYRNQWAFRDFQFPTNDPVLLRGPAGRKVFGEYQGVALDIAGIRYLWQKVVERRQRLLRQP